MIRVDYNSLSGSISESFTGVTNLTTLSVAVSNLTRMVPGKLFQLPTLRAIDLSTNNHLYGTVPPFYKNLSLSLEELILDNTKLSRLLPSTTMNLKRLRKIDLSGCKFQGSIPSSMGSLSLLEEMDLSANQFSGPTPSFSSMKNIKSLKFEQNNLNGSITATDWGELLKLEVLDMSNNTLDGSILTSLFSLTSLHTIDLGQNKFSGKIQLNELARITSSKLETLDLSSNDLEGTVPNSIFQLRELTTLDLSSNRFYGKLKLSELLQGLNNLKTLGLSHNNLSINTDSYGVNSSFPQLQILYLASSNLHTVPGFLKNQTALTNLDLSKNQISGGVPHWMWRIDSLLILNLSYNHFQNLEPPHTNKSKLFFLDLQSNNLQGQVPVISSNIVLLDCSSNNFISIHPDFGNHLSEAMFLSFSRNWQHPCNIVQCHKASAS
ncbi:hypothetical protein BVRB_3g067800 [Beta vulgaris subsp. vulgaris]|uniref:Uncharacterized protein n=1 Tax=Beta vulgaris subsp. vulgaris TaxID=3555 RepID=A0A0J8BDB3_BETVV|nr:hypothetical protein BVRB_3g067800 [Beta vulgaris subsp. vulgaris]